jgi:hypothetical protein
MDIALQACSIVIKLRLSANGRTSTRSLRKNSSGCIECRKVPYPLNQCHTLDGRDNVIEKISAMPIR